MIIDKYEKGRPFGKYFGVMVNSMNKAIREKDDDTILIITGTTGSGKSNLGLWTYEDVFSNPEIEQVALTQQDFAKALKRATTLPRGNRYLQYDEGKLNRRQWQQQWSQDLLEIYHDCRGLNIFHIWCTAYPNLLDREFIKERVKGLAFIFTKDKHRPRQFYYFTKRDLLRFLEKNQKITTDLLKKYGKSFAHLHSWFTKYEGPLARAYLDKKEDRMTEQVEKFFEKYGQGESFSLLQASKLLRVNDDTLRKYATMALKEGLLPESVKAPSGHWRLNEKTIEILSDFMVERTGGRVYG